MPWQDHINKADKFTNRHAYGVSIGEYMTQEIRV